MRPQQTLYGLVVHFIRALELFWRLGIKHPRSIFYYY